MFSYLLKVTIIWGLLLCLYQLLYRKSPAFTMNRLYLFVALAAGILLPFVTWDMPWSTQDAVAVTAINNGLQNLETSTQPAAQQPARGHSTISVFQLLAGLYLSGMIIAAIWSVREIVLILRTAIYGQFKMIGGHRIFSSKHQHAPFSFMGWIFIAHPEGYTHEQLHYILRHEDGHNSRKHWLDMILMQIVFVVFWFHPLVWYFRYALKLVHEYEADEIAADNNTYDYGHFLLEQTLLKGTPSIAHSFHFSPIKNRITMLTAMKKNNKWKYTLVLPVMLGCTILFAKSATNNQRVRVGDKTTFASREFYWSKGPVDSIMVADAVTNETTWVVMQQSERIVRAGKEKVYSVDKVALSPQFRYDNKTFKQYMEERFKTLAVQVPDSIAQIMVNNLVLDDQGKMIYFDLMYINTSTERSAVANKFNKTLDPIVEDMLLNGPAWLPGTIDGKPVYTFTGMVATIDLKVQTIPADNGQIFKGKLINPEEKK